MGLKMTRTFDPIELELLWRRLISMVDEAAVDAALRSGHLAAAGVDVLREEPMVEPPAMLAHDNMIVTPHVAASTTEGLYRMAWDSAGNVIDFLAGKVDRDAVVNGEVLAEEKK